MDRIYGNIRRLIVVLLFLIIQNQVYCQDTISISLLQGQILSGGQTPGTVSYYSGRTEDTIYMYYRISRDKKVIITYTRYGVDDLWAAYYKNGTLMQIGHFEKFKTDLFTRKSSSKDKVGPWFYFSSDGKLIDIRMGKRWEL